MSPSIGRRRPCDVGQGALQSEEGGEAGSSPGPLAGPGSESRDVCRISRTADRARPQADPGSPGAVEELSGTLATVRRIMWEEGFHQAEVAQACGMSQAHLSKLLAGKVELSNEIADGLNRWLDSRDQFRDLKVLGRIGAALRRRPAHERRDWVRMLRTLDHLLQASGEPRDREDGLSIRGG